MHRIRFALMTLMNWSHNRNQRESEGGQSIVIMVIGVVALLAFAGLVFDGGTAYAQFRRMQNAADAGALAGALELSKKNNKAPDPTTSKGAICAAARKYATELNGKSVYGGQTLSGFKVQYILKDKSAPLVNDNSCKISGHTDPAGPPPTDAIGVRVTVATTFETFFLGLAGIGNGTSVAHASAQYGTAMPHSFQPLAKKCKNPEDPDKQCGLKYGDPPEDIWDSSQPGNFGWLAWNGDPNSGQIEMELDPTFVLTGPGTGDHQYWDDYGSPPCSAIDVGCWVQGAPGVTGSSGIKSALNDWIASGKPMTIIIYDNEVEPPGGGGSNSEYHIAGFASFIVTGYDLDHKKILGRFQKWYPTAATICDDCVETGLYTVQLIPDVAEPPPAPPTKGRICVAVMNDLNNNALVDTEDYYAEGATVGINGPGYSNSWVSQGVSINCVDELDQGSYTVTEVNPTSPIPLPADSQPKIDVPLPHPGVDTANSRFVDLRPMDNGGDGLDVIVNFLDYQPSSGNIIVQAFDDPDGSGGEMPPHSAFTLGADITVWDSTNRIVGTGKTGITGTLFLRNRPPDTYKIQATAVGYDTTTTNPITGLVVTTGVTRTVQFGFKYVDNGELCVSVLDDANNNGIKDGTEVLLSGSGYISAMNNSTGETWNTQPTGKKCWQGVPAGLYTISEVNPTGYTSLPDASGDTMMDVAVLDKKTTDVVFRDWIPPTATICVLVYDDTNADGNWSGGEMLAMNAELSITGPVPQAWRTNGSEPHCYPNMPLGNYNVHESNPPGYSSTTADDKPITVAMRDTTYTASFGDRMSTPTPTSTQTPTPKNPSPTPSLTKTLTPTKTNTPPAGATYTPTPTATPTSVPGALCVTVYNDANTNYIRDLTPTPGATPETTLQPKNVAVKNSLGSTVGTWDGAGVQPYCFLHLPPDDYTSVETNPDTYRSTTADSVTSPVNSSQSTQVLFGDKLCVLKTPVMGTPLRNPDGSYYLHWENVGALDYEIWGSFTSQTAMIPPEAWHKVAVVSSINYTVIDRTRDGTFYFVKAWDGCILTNPSNVVALP